VIYVNIFGKCKEKNTFDEWKVFSYYLENGIKKLSEYCEIPESIDAIYHGLHECYFGVASCVYHYRGCFKQKCEMQWRNCFLMFGSVTSFTSKKETANAFIKSGLGCLISVTINKQKFSKLPIANISWIASKPDDFEILVNRGVMLQELCNETWVGNKQHVEFSNFVDNQNKNVNIPTLRTYREYMCLYALFCNIVLFFWPLLYLKIIFLFIFISASIFYCKREKSLCFSKC